MHFIRAFLFDVSQAVYAAVLALQFGKIFHGFLNHFFFAGKVIDGCCSRNFHGRLFHGLTLQHFFRSVFGSH